VVVAAAEDDLEVVAVAEVRRVVLDGTETEVASLPEPGV
jgi:hypothetical protein